MAAPTWEGALAPYNDKDAWLEVRNGLIGATDVPAILGRGPYDPAAQKVWDRIVLGRTEQERIEKSGDVRRGRKFEPVAADTFVERTGLQVKRWPMKAHPDLPFFVTDVDRLVVSVEEADWPEALRGDLDWQPGPGALEIKVPRVSNFYKMRDEGLPLEYIIQHQSQMSVTGWKWGLFAFYTPEYDDLIWFPVIRDDVFISRILEPQVAMWWENHIEGEIRPERPLPEPPRWPDPVPGEATLRSDPAWEAAAADYREAEYDLGRAEMKVEAAEAQLVDLMGEEDQHVAGAGIVVKRYSTTSQHRFDAKAFRAAVELAQKNGDTERLLSLDPEDDEFYYDTTPSEKIKIIVTAAIEAEEEAIPA